VVGHHAHPDVVVAVGAVPPARELLRGADDGEHLVDLVHVVDALEQVGRALEPHAGVDVLLAQFPEQREVLLPPAGAALVLHENQVPDLQVAVLVHHRAALAAVLRPAVDVDLRARPRRPGLTRGPEVVLHAAALDPLVRQAGDGLPETGRLVVVVEHRDPDRVGVEAVAAVRLRARHEFPGVGDRPLLEVVPEGEVAVHLEERAVPGGLADLFDVEGPHTLLHARQARRRRRALAQHVGDERHHAGDREQQGRVLGDQRGRGHHDVAPALEVLQPAASDLGGAHAYLNVSSNVRNPVASPTPRRGLRTSTTPRPRPPGSPSCGARDGAGPGPRGRACRRPR